MQSLMYSQIDSVLLDMYHKEHYNSRPSKAGSAKVRHTAKNKTSLVFSNLSFEATVPALTD